MVQELRSHFYSSGTRGRPAPTVIVTCGRLPWPIRVLHEKSMKVTFSSDRDHLHRRAGVDIGAKPIPSTMALPTGVAHPCDMDCPKWRLFAIPRRPEGLMGAETSRGIDY